jgi:hypothetical protein
MKLSAEQKQAVSSFTCWWAMTQAHFELANNPMRPEEIALDFMGSGASTMVTAGELHEVITLLDIFIQKEEARVNGEEDEGSDIELLYNELPYATFNMDNTVVTFIKSILNEVDLHTKAEAAAKALEKRKRQEQYEWTDEQFETWWNKDDRCKRDELVQQAKFLIRHATSSLTFPIYTEDY